jgi:hypothetical protein
MNDWDSIKNNQITVDLKPVEIPEDLKSKWTGLSTYGLNLIEDGNISFYCGPQMKESAGQGEMDSCEDGGLYPKLELLFPDMDIEVGAAENYHIVKAHDMDAEDLWKVIEARLKRSGAVE